MHEVIESTLKGLLDSMGASYSSIERSEIAGQNIFSIKTDDARTLIGMHGDTVFALDLLVKKILEKHPDKRGEKQEPLTDGEPASREDEHFLIDVNDYRSKQIKDLQTKAIMMAERARSFEYDVELTPMSAYERLIIHTTLQDAPNIKTISEGEGRNRRVVIKYAPTNS